MADRAENAPAAPGPRRDEGARHEARGLLYGDVLLEFYRYRPGPAGVTAGHSHDEYQLCLGFSPPNRYRYRGGWHLVPPRSLSVVMPGEVHATVETEDRDATCAYRALYIEPDRLRDVAAELGCRRPGLPFFADMVLRDQELTAAFHRLHTAFDGPSFRLGRDVGLVSLLATLVGRHTRLRAPAEPPTGPPRAVRIARAYLEDNHAANVSLEDLAGAAGLSPFHLARLFRQEVGLPPHAYQLQVRIARAKRLLLSGMPVSHVAGETGFFDLSHLTRHFKRHLGVTPGHYARGEPPQG